MRTIKGNNFEICRKEMERCKDTGSLKPENIDKKQIVKVMKLWQFSEWSATRAIQRTAQTLTTEYRRAAEVTQRGDTAFHTGRFFMRRRPFADRLLSACRTAADAAERIYSWHFSTAQ